MTILKLVFFFSYENVCLQYFANSTADVYYKSNWLPCMKDMAVSQAPNLHP